MTRRADARVRDSYASALPWQGETMHEDDVRAFWEARPCGDHIVGGLDRTFQRDYERFFRRYDAWRYHQEGHILACLDRFDWHGREVLEIGLGQGAESEQLIRRGARWSGLDLTEESVNRVSTRLTLRNLPYRALKQGSALSIPYPDNSFDMVFSHGVLHHIPDINRAQEEILRVLRPGGELVAMVYARGSLNYQVSIRFVRRAAVAMAYPLRRSSLVPKSGLLRRHLDNAQEVGIGQYLRMENFTHRNTDGPANPFARVYSRSQLVRDFPAFDLVETFQAYMHAPPLPVHGLPGAGLLGWHLWARLRAKDSDQMPSEK